MIAIHLPISIFISASIYLMSRRLAWSIMCALSYITITHISRTYNIPHPADIGLIILTAGIYLFLSACANGFGNFFVLIISSLFLSMPTYFDFAFIASPISAYISLMKHHDPIVKKIFLPLTFVGTLTAVICRFAMPPVTAYNMPSFHIFVANYFLAVLPYIALSGIYTYIYMRSYRLKIAPSFINLHLLISIAICLGGTYIKSLNGTAGILSVLLIIAGASAGNELSDWIRYRVAQKSIPVRIYIILVIVFFHLIAHFL